MWPRRVFGPIVAASWSASSGSLKLKFLIFAVAKFGFVTTPLTMVVSVGAYTLLWGWRFAALFVLLLFVHELGHALWLRKEGIPAGAPVFIPFLGAADRHARTAARRLRRGQGRPRGAGARHARRGGRARASASTRTPTCCCAAARHTGFLLNLFNLLPIVPLDGGRAMAAIHPALWIAGIAGLAALLIVAPNAILILILVLGGREAWLRWRTRNGRLRTRATTPSPAAQRVLIAVVYIGLAAVCVLGMRAGYVNT